MFGKLKPTIDVSSLLVIARYQEALCKNYDDLEQVQMKLPLRLCWRRILHYFTIYFQYISRLYVYCIYIYYICFEKVNQTMAFPFKASVGKSNGLCFLAEVMELYVTPPDDDGNIVIDQWPGLKLWGPDWIVGCFW